MQKTNYVNTLLLILLISMCSIACNVLGEPMVAARGVVKDVTGNTLEGVNVVFETLNRVPKKAITKKDGVFDLTFIGADPKKTKITFTKNGYKSFERQFEVEGQTEFNVILESDS